MNITTEEKNLLAKLASGELDGQVGEESTGTDRKDIYCGMFIKNGEPVAYRQTEAPRFLGGKENEHIPGKRSEEHYNTDECKLEFLREYGWLMKDNDARQYSARFKSGKQS